MKTNKKLIIVKGITKEGNERIVNYYMEIGRDEKQVREMIAEEIRNYQKPKPY